MAEPSWIEQLRIARRQRRMLADWADRGYAAPSPPFVKRAVLQRHAPSNPTWVETGTFEGDTTAFLAANGARKVYTIEPEPKLHAAAAERFKGQDSIEVLNGLSEAVLPGLLPRLSGNVAFWLDGHYSAGFTHKGPKDTPIVEELQCIGAALKGWDRVAVLVDDVRCFEPTDPEFADYPDRSHLVRWADEHKLVWSIEHDIFIAKNFR
jgi:hypothetical protein